MKTDVFIGYPSRKRDIPVRRLIPNLLTVIALCSGLAAIHFALKSDWDRALSAVAVAAIFDALDGRAARLLRATSPFGAVLDSLSDFLAFGVAPALLLHQWMLARTDAIGLAAVMTFALCAALRLARFTAAVQRPRVDPDEHAPAWTNKFFVGMPTPAAAGCVLLPMLVEQSRLLKNTRWPEWSVVVFTFVVAGLMISRLPMFSFKKARIERRFVVPLMVVIGLLVVLASRDPWLTATLICGGYLLTLPLSVWRYREHRRADHAAASALATTSGDTSQHSAPRGLELRRAE
ncbi:MAG: phosphatidylcholine/phosphatidylserine synthase [Phycisphaeraceae bacterium]|nr:phosphatidylcholine/phosphatidylserine synthase [Phycisphaeraceae bacterium]